MSLIRCEECYNYFSEYADKCPKCGKELNESIRKYIDDIDVSEAKYEENYFTYAREKIQKEEKRKKKNLRIIIFTLIGLVICIGVFMYAEYNNSKKLFEENKEKLVVLEGILGMSDDLDGVINLPRTAYEYYKNGVTLFEDVYGEVSLYNASTRRGVDTVNKVRFESVDDVNAEKAESIMKELEWVYGEPVNTEIKEGIYDGDVIITTWKKDNHTILFSREENREGTIILLWEWKSNVLKGE